MDSQPGLRSRNWDSGRILLLLIIISSHWAKSNDAGALTCGRYAFDTWMRLAIIHCFCRTVKTARRSSVALPGKVEMETIGSRYTTAGTWYKGNTHIHSTRSDGGLNYRQIAEMYADAGYDFLFFTDHGCAAPPDEIADLPLLGLNGVEFGGFDGQGDYHAAALGYSGPLCQEISFAEQFGQLKENGALMVLAHPYWTGNSFSDALRYDFDGVEVYNHVCNWISGRSRSTHFWDRMLQKNPNVLAFSSDDAHLTPDHPVWNGGWIVVCAESLSTECIFEAIRDGSFYSSTGPELKSIRVTRERIELTCSAVREVRLLSEVPTWGKRIGSEGGVTEAAFDVESEHLYLRIELEDAYGRRGWTNTVLRG